MALQHDPEKQARLDFEGDTTVPAPIYDKSYSEHHDAASPTSYDPILDRYSDADIKRVVRKVDLRLIPLCGLMYCVSLLDRTNLSNAAIAG